MRFCRAMRSDPGRLGRGYVNPVISPDVVEKRVLRGT